MILRMANCSLLVCRNHQLKWELRFLLLSWVNLRSIDTRWYNFGRLPQNDFAYAKSRDVIWCFENWPQPLLRGLNLCESPVTPMIWNFLASAMIGYICMHVMMSSSISISWQNAAGWIKGSRIHSIISAIYAERFGLSCSIQFRAALYRFQFFLIVSNACLILYSIVKNLSISIRAKGLFGHYILYKQ